MQKDLPIIRENKRTEEFICSNKHYEEMAAFVNNKIDQLRNEERIVIHYSITELSEILKAEIVSVESIEI